MISSEGSPKLELYQQPERPQPEDRYILSDALAEQIAPEIVDMYGDFGLDGTFLAILGRHARDTHATIAGNSNQGVTLTTALPCVNGGKNSTCWQRQLYLPKYSVDRYDANIREALHTIWEISPRAVPREHKDIFVNGVFAPEVTKTLAVKMLFAEASVDMLGNSVYMQHRFEKYIPDFNGQSPHYSCELEVPRQFFKQYGATEPSERELRTDLQALRRGIGLQFLKTDLLRLGILSKMAYADWLTNGMAQENPKKFMNGPAVIPHDEQAIAQRILTLEPKFGARKAIIELALSIDEE